VTRRLRLRTALCETITEAVKRVAYEQIDGALAEVADDGTDDHETVHQVRKRCKKVRGLLRLVRPQFGSDFSQENAWYRDSARNLSYVRDAQSIVECLDGIVDHFGDNIEGTAFDTIRSTLSKRRDLVAHDRARIAEGLERFRERMLVGRARVEDWTVDPEGFPALRVAKPYHGRKRRGRQALRHARRRPRSVRL
jgi:hypothetical protein